MLKNKKWLAIILGVVILGTVAVGTAMASSSTTSSQSPYQTFLGNLASALGISQATLTTDLQQASTQTVNQELQSGKITQQQASQMLSRINKGMPFGFMGMGSRNNQSVAGAVYGKQHGSRMGGSRGLILKPLASALGMNAKDLMSALRSGQTISALATAKGTTVAALQSTILSSIQSQLTSAVQSGKMTQAQETKIYNKLQQSISSGNWVTQLQKIRQPRNHQQSGGQQATT
jgi:hypothetical protein